MQYILDTDTISNLIKRNSPFHDQLVNKLQKHQPEQLYMSIFTKSELYFGLGRVDNRKKQYKAQLKKAIDAFVASINILGISGQFAEIYGEVRSGLVNKGQDIGVIDCMIAAQAMASNLTLVSHNTKHYQRILNLNITPKLKLVDWLS